jgi:FixJ family two-component response regulator
MAVVFVVDDDASIRRALGRMLQEEGFEVRACESGEAFLADLPDAATSACVVLDVSMPGLSGLDLQEHLTSKGLSLPIVFLTGHGDIPMSVRAVKRGAADFLTKPVASEVLLQAVRSALHQQEIRRRQDAELIELQKRFEMLSAREREVLEALADGKLNKQIAEALEIVEQTVKYHRARIMERMGARTAAELMHMAARLRIKPGTNIATGTMPDERSLS